MEIMMSKGMDRADFSTVDLEPEAEKRLNVIMNKVGGRWDTPRLEELLASMKGEGIDLASLGFSPVELKTLHPFAVPLEIIGGEFLLA